MLWWFDTKIYVVPGVMRSSPSTATRTPVVARIQPRPRARAAVREIAAVVEQARHERRRAEHDRVNGDGGDEVEDRPPPMVGRDAQFGQDCCAAVLTTAGATACGTAPDSMYRPKIIFPAVVCRTLVTTMSMVLLIILRALSTTTIVPSSR